MIDNCMDPNEFKQKIAEFAHIEYVKANQLDPQDDLNDSRNLRVKAVKPIAQSCPDCDLPCKDRKIQWIRLTSPVTVWREHCTACKRSRNPETGDFDVLPCRFPFLAQKYLKNQQKK
jgi:hypothetical protein